MTENRRIWMSQLKQRENSFVLLLFTLLRPLADGLRPICIGGGSLLYLVYQSKCQSPVEVLSETPLSLTFGPLLANPTTQVLLAFLTSVWPPCFSPWRDRHSGLIVVCNPMDCSLPGSSVHGILQARILEWIAIPFSRGSSQPRDQTRVSRIAGRFFTFWATKESQCSVSAH